MGSASGGGGVRAAWVGFVALVAVAIPAAPAGAADGELDPSFGGDGRVVSDVTTALDDNMNDLAVDAAGRIVTVGTGYQPSGAGPARALIARYTPDGALDPSFSGDGVARIEWTVESEGATAVAIDSKGRIVVGGSAARPTTKFDFAAARFLPDGSLDPSFDGDGRALVDIPGAGFETAVGIAVDAGDRVLLAGDASGAGNFYAALVRLGANGALDPSFDGDGRLLTSFPGFASAGAGAVTIDGGGRAVVGGVASNPGDARTAAARYTEGGGYDLGFGTAGRALLDFGALPGEGTDAVAVDAAGRIVLVGTAGMAGGYVIDVGRLLPDGSPDPSFGSGGRTTTQIPTYAYASDAAIDRAGRIVVAGSVGSSLSQDALLARYLPSGVLDPSFGSGGIVREDFLGQDAWGGALAIDAAGRYLLGGTAAGPGDARVFGLARFLTTYPEPDPGSTPTSGSQPKSSTPGPQPQPSTSGPPTQPPTSDRSEQPGAARGRATAARVVRVRKGRALLRLHCHGAGGCHGVVELLPRARRAKPAGKHRGAGRLARPRGHGKRKLLGRASFTLAAGGRGTISVRIRRAAREQLRRAGRRGLPARLRGDGIAPRAVVLKAARPRRHRA